MTIAVDWDVKQKNKQTNPSTQDFGSIARMRPLCVHLQIVGLETYCVRYALILLQLNVYRSSKVSSEAL